MAERTVEESVIEGEARIEKEESFGLLLAAAAVAAAAGADDDDEDY